MKRLAFLLLCTLCLGLVAWGAQTPLTATVSATAGTCENGIVPVTLTFVVSSGNASPASLTWSFAKADAESPLASGAQNIVSGMVSDGGDWQQATSGPVKTFTYTTTVFVSEAGTYTAEMEVEQVGGNYDPVTASGNITVDINCAAPNVCDQVAVRGQVVGNTKNLAKNVTPINFNIRGAFGDTLTLTLKNNTSGAVTTLYISRNGNSCEYTYSWIPSAAGDYTATVTGNGNTTVFSFQVTFKK